MKVKIGITGQDGFIGQHLYNNIGLFPEKFERIEFKRDFFLDQESLNAFVAQCDVIIHLAAMNRHNDADVLYKVNIGLVTQLIIALEHTGNKAHVIFSSSSQEERDNMYGRSKKEGRELLMNWAAKSNGTFTGLVIPNVFGPFGSPFYNSFIATFSSQLTCGEIPKIEVDGEVKLIYVGDLSKIILEEILRKSGNDILVVPHTKEINVSSVLGLLEMYNDQYGKLGIIPELSGSFEVNLFNTFRSYLDVKNHYPVKYTTHSDPRGTFVEVIRLNIGGQVSFSTTVAGVTRGNHYHTRKIERFAVIKGKALIQLRRIGSDEVLDFYLSGDEPAYVDMPIWYTHNIKNIGDEELFTNFWINEFYDANDPDTYFEEV